MESMAPVVEYVAGPLEAPRIASDSRLAFQQNDFREIAFAKFEGSPDAGGTSAENGDSSQDDVLRPRPNFQERAVSRKVAPL